jgi:excisionase family DNA binding protein
MTAQPSYGTVEIGRFLGVSRPTAAKLIDAGTIRGFRPPGTDRRRVWHADLIAFLKSRPDLRPLIRLIEVEVGAGRRHRVNAPSSPPVRRPLGGRRAEGMKETPLT